MLATVNAPSRATSIGSSPRSSSATVARAKADVTAMAVLAEGLRQPSQDWYVASDRAMIALLEGRLAEAEELIYAAHSLGERAQGWHAAVTYRLQLYVLRREQGRLEEIEPLIRSSVEEYPTYPAWLCVLVHMLTLLGHADEARKAFEALAEDDFAEVPFDEEWLVGMTPPRRSCACARRHAARRSRLRAPAPLRRSRRSELFREHHRLGRSLPRDSRCDHGPLGRVGPPLRRRAGRQRADRRPAMACAHARGLRSVVAPTRWSRRSREGGAALVARARRLPRAGDPRLPFLFSTWKRRPGGAPLPSVSRREDGRSVAQLGATVAPDLRSWPRRR